MLPDNKVSLEEESQEEENERNQVLLTSFSFWTYPAISEAIRRGTVMSNSYIVIHSQSNKKAIYT